jgi:hypothetical protein
MHLLGCPCLHADATSATHGPDARIILARCLASLHCMSAVNTRAVSLFGTFFFTSAYHRISVCMCVFVYVSECVCVCVCVCMRVYIHTYIYIYIYMPESMYEYMCIYMCVCTYIYIYIFTTNLFLFAGRAKEGRSRFLIITNATHIHTSTDMHVYIYIYTYIHAIYSQGKSGPTEICIWDIHHLQERFYFEDNIVPRLESGMQLLVQKLDKEIDENMSQVSICVSMYVCMCVGVYVCDV